MKTRTVAVIYTAIFLSTSAHAGSLSDPVVEPEVIVAETEQSSEDVQGLLAALAVMTIVLGAAGAF